MAKTLLLLTAAAVAASCAGDPGQEDLLISPTRGSSLAEPVQSCPVTIPDGEFTPPPPYPAQPPDLYDAQWYGSNRLWTMISRDQGSWMRRDDHYIQKLFYWREYWPEGFDTSAERSPPLRVTATRIDTPTITVEAAPPTHGTRADIGNFILAGIAIPSPGCWEIEAGYGDVRLSYIVRIEQA